VLESIAENKEALENDLHDLMNRGLLQYDKNNKIFDLHPIVRRYAYDQLTAADRATAHSRLVNYFDAVPKPENVKTLEDLAPVIELYHHMVRAGNLDEARVLFRDRISQSTYYQFGAYQLRIELLDALFLDGEDKPPRLKDESAQAWTLNGLANTYALSGQPHRAVPLFEQAIKLGEAKELVTMNAAEFLLMLDNGKNQKRLLMLAKNKKRKHTTFKDRALFGHIVPSVFC
jgi:tetratricopeptide (TPR) repeat protein